MYQNEPTWTHPEFNHFFLFLGFDLIVVFGQSARQEFHMFLFHQESFDTRMVPMVTE